MTTPDRLEADWLTAPESRAVVEALEAVQPGSARFVGGCIRNAIMGRPVDDIDIATPLVPGAVMEGLAAAGIRAIPTGLDHGTVTAIAGGQPFEITTLRRDVETDGRRAVVAFTEDWAEDAARRDFRLNALYAAPDGTLFDPTGGGLADAAKGRVIFIGDADQRLEEDYLRILRFFRFNAWYGAVIDEAGLAACGRQKAGLAQIAAERKWKELKKLLAAPAPDAAIAAAERSGLDTDLFGAPLAAGWAVSLSAERALGLEADPMRRLMALSGAETGVADRLRRDFRLSNAEHRRLVAWLGVDAAEVEAGDTASAMRRLIYRHGADAVLDRALTAISGPLRLSAARRVLGGARAWRVPDFPLTGADAKAAGLGGPRIGAALRAVETAWIDSDFTLDRSALLARLSALHDEG